MNGVKHRYILLVEDNPDDIELTIRALRKNKIMNRVEVVHDGTEALEFLRGEGRHAGRNGRDLPVCLFLDLKLPKMDGLEVLKAIRKDPALGLLPVIILTSSKEEQDLVSGYQLGANSYVRKPVDFEEFVGVARQLGLYWLLVNEPPPRGGGK